MKIIRKDQEERCHKEKGCLKEINPEEYPSKFIGKPYVYEDNRGACHHCKINDLLKKGE